MPLFSEHISNMYYGGSPSYSSPSYGYKSSYVPLGTSYSASYLSPGGNYSNHSSLGSYSRSPLTSRWVPGMSRSYSPMLTPISERGTASPLRIHSSPRRIPIAKRCYGTPSYIQRPININTESIDVSRDRYRPRATPEPSYSAPVVKPQNENEVKDKESGPFMPRVDGKPETGIDSSPGIQRSTIKRGRTVVRLHTIKRKDKDSPRKPVETEKREQDGDNNELNVSEAIIDEVVLEEPKESLSWREKLSEDLVYVDKKEKKSLGTKLVEKFIVKDKNEPVNSEGTSHIALDKTSSNEIPSTSKSPDRRYSLEMLAEQANILDTLIRGENLSTTSLDLSKVGLSEAKNKFVSSDSIKRRKTDEKGNPLKTTKSDHSLHENLSKSLKGSKDPKAFSKRRSLKKSQSGGSICRLDSITELPKESVRIDLPVINENKFSPKEQKMEEKPKIRTKITGSVEVSPPTSPLKFIIENVTVEEKLHKPKKEISFSYEIEETPVQDILVQVPNTTLRRTKERNSIKKKSKKVLGTDPISPEPDDGNFWAKIGKRETVYLMKRKQNIEAAREENKRSHFWFQENYEPIDVSNSSDAKIECNNLSNQMSNSDISCDIKTSGVFSEVKDKAVKDIQLKNVTKLEKSQSSDNMQKISPDTHNTSIKEKKTKSVAESKSCDILPADKVKSQKNVVSPDAEIKVNKETIEILSGTASNLDNDLTTNTELVGEKSAITNIIGNIGISKPPKINQTISSLDQIQSKNTGFLNLGKVTKEESQTDETKKIDSTVNLDQSIDKKIHKKIESINSEVKIKPQASEVKDKTIEINEKPNTESIQSNINNSLNLNLSSEILAQPKINTESISNERDVKPSIKNVVTIQASVPHSETTEITAVEEKKQETTALKNQSQPTKVSFTSISENIAKEPKLGDIESTNKNIEDGTQTVKLETGEQVKSSECNVSLVLSADIRTAVVEQAASQVLNTSESIINVGETVLQLDKVTLVEHVKTTETAPTENIVEKKGKVSTLRKQAKSKIDESKTQLLTKSKKEGSSSNNNVQIDESVNKNDSTAATTTTSKKKVKKVRVKSSDKNKGEKSETKDNVLKDNICETCKKSLASDDKKTKLNTTKVSNSIIPKPTNGNDSVTSKTVDKPIISLQKSKSDLDQPETLISNLKTETSALPSQVPVVVETKNIPSDAVANETEQKIQIEVPSQKETVEENKAEKESAGKDKVERSSVKKVAKKPVKQEKPVKPLIATPRPLLKRAPQVIHSDSSESSSEEDSPEEEDSDTSENSETVEFFECDNNPDGRTSTGSNDSGFDSSAPTSPASFLQIKKDCDVNCHRKCEKLTANLCGVNQRLLVEALATRTASKKGGDSPAPGTSSSNATSLPDAEVGDSELELEQSTAYGLFKKTGKFTPPARSIPRFRKYNIEDFQFIKVLGKGSFGKVLLAELRDTEYYYAVKCLKKDVVLEDDDVECTLIERKVLALGTNHPYLCHLFATFQTDSHLFFVMEYLNGGDLMFHIQQSGRFPEPRARFYAAEIVSGLKFLHKRGIVYRDLKLDNILLDFDGHVRIADFGMCKLQIYLDKTADTFCGTPDYMAPEIIKGLKYNQTVDWWSFGVLLYEMLIGQSPFSGCDEDELFWSICNEMPSYPRFLSREALTVLTRLLDKDAKTRLGGTECMHGDVREQDFFHPVHWDRLERRELETPFKPRVRHPLDTQYFDRAFTGERPRLTAVEPHVLRSMDQEPFRGFSYTNPNATDR